MPIQLTQLLPRLRKQLARRGVLLVLLLIVLIFAVPPLYRWTLRTYVFPFYGLVPPTSPYRHDTTPRLGNMEGVPLAIPSNLLEFAVEYMDKSAWEAKGKGYYESKTLADPIRNFALYVHWPDLAGRTAQNEESFWASQKTLGAKEWIGISVTNDFAKARYTYTGGFDWLLKLRLERLTTQPLRLPDETLPRMHPEIRYEINSADPITGLQSAIPVGPGTEAPFMGNDALYWQGDVNKRVHPFIECPRGQLPNSKHMPNCQHKYELPELGAYVTLYYTANLLPHWQELQSKTRDFVLALRTQPASPTDAQ